MIYPKRMMGLFITRRGHCRDVSGGIPTNTSHVALILRGANEQNPWKPWGLEDLNELGQDGSRQRGEKC